jgi:hypothetical protein
MDIFCDFDIKNAEGKIVCDEGSKVDIDIRADYLSAFLAFKNHNEHLSFMVKGFSEVVALKYLKIFTVCDSLSND